MIDGQNNIETSSLIVCPLCGQPSEAVFPENQAPICARGRVFENRSCSRCDAIFCQPMPTKDEIEYIYTKRYDFEWFRRRAILKRAQAAHRFLRLRHIWFGFGRGEIPRFLDVGCGHGWLVGHAQRANWKATGIDFLDDEQVQSARLSGIEIHNSSIEQFRTSNGSYDLISVWHALEHTSEPREVLLAIANLLALNGIVVIAVPNRNASSFRKAGVRWGWLQKPFIHTWSFSADVMRYIMPSNLLIERVTTRDTWDQQWIVYTAPFKWLCFLVDWIFRALGAVCRKLKLFFLVKILDKTCFFILESLMVITYFGYLMLRRLPIIKNSYEERLEASELLVIARKIRV